MIYCINYLLEFFINAAIFTGICLLVYFYFKLNSLDKKIENEYAKFERKKKECNDVAKNEGISEVVYSNQVKRLQKELDESTGSYKREKDRIISKIPFLK